MSDASDSPQAPSQSDPTPAQPLPNQRSESGIAGGPVGGNGGDSGNGAPSSSAMASRPKIGDVRRVVSNGEPTEESATSATSPAGDDSGSANEENPSADGRSSNKRRRGSRGGKNRRKPSSTRSAPTSGEDGDSYPQAGSDEEIARRPADLPDSPFEGVPSAEAAARAEVRPRRSPNRRPEEERSEGASNSSDSTEDLGDSSPTAGGNRPNKRRKRGQRRPGSGDGGSSGSNDDSSEGLPPEESTVGSGEGSPKGAVLARPADGPLSERPAKIGEQKTAKGPRPKRGRVELSEAEAAERRRGKERNGKPLGRYLMCVHHHAKATQIATLEGRSLIEHYVSRPADLVGQIHGNIYIGRVQNVLPGMEAAFVDISTPKNAVLYRGDISFDSSDVEGGSKKNNDLRIEQMLRNGQMLVCQVTKNPIGSKGARLTQEVSIPGRFVVLVPNSDTYGISKRLADDERRRLRQILDQIRPEQHGLIVRTAAEGATADELTRDVEMLLKQWAAIEEKAKKAKGPALLYREPDMAVRVIREEFNRNYRGVVIDDRQLFEEVRSYVESITPELADRVEYFDASVEPLPLFEKHHIHEQLHKAIDRKVWLPSGGSLIIERTEALTVIDVNTGKNVGTSSLEETVFRNNLEAADEIARQLRLRDIGGIIVIDFIDMENRANREAVTTAFRSALALDKTRTQVFEISELGLVEMTRKRISEGLVESLSNTCPSCSGRGFVFDEDLVGE